MIAIESVATQDAFCWQAPHEYISVGKATYAVRVVPGSARKII